MATELLQKKVQEAVQEAVEKVFKEEGQNEGIPELRKNVMAVVEQVERQELTSRSPAGAKRMEHDIEV